MNKYKVLVLIFLAMSLSGCIQIKTGQDGVNMGGVYKSTDKGESWHNVSVIPTITGKPLNFTKLNVASLLIDPSDNKAIYYGSFNNGLLYSYDSGLNWQIAKSLGDGTIRSVGVDPRSKCTIYVSRGNKVYKSMDCNRSWSQIYQDNDPAATVDNVLVDHYNSNIIYITISRGDLVKSLDAGNSWQTINRFEDGIKKVVINSSDSREIFIATNQKGVFKTVDAGGNWTRLIELDNALKEHKIRYSIRDLIVMNGRSSANTTERKIIYVVTYYGLIKSEDNGFTWQMIKLIPPEEKASINAVTINENNIDEIYYVTNTTFYKSVDGGQSWKTLPLPSLRAGWKLQIDNKSPNIIYMGMMEIKK